MSEDAPEDPPLNATCVVFNSLHTTWQPPQLTRPTDAIKSSVATAFSSKPLGNSDFLRSDKVVIESYNRRGMRIAPPLTCTTKEDIPSKLKAVQSGPESLAVCWLPHPRPTGRVP